MTALMVPQWTMEDRLRKAREAAGFDQKELAETIGVARNTIGNYESGATTHHRRIVLNQWALATGVPLEWLRSGNEPESGPDSTPDQANDQSGWMCGSGDDGVVVPLSGGHHLTRMGRAA